MFDDELARPFDVSEDVVRGTSKGIRCIPNKANQYASDNQQCQRQQSTRSLLLLELRGARSGQVQIKIQVNDFRLRGDLTVILKAFGNQLLRNGPTANPVALQIHPMIFCHTEVTDIALHDFLEEVFRQPVDHICSANEAKHNSRFRVHESFTAVNNILAILWQT